LGKKEVKIQVQAFIFFLPSHLFLPIFLASVASKMGTQKKKKKKLLLRFGALILPENERMREVTP